MDIRSGSVPYQHLWDHVAALNEPLSDNCIRVFLSAAGGIIKDNSMTYPIGYSHEPLNYGSNAAVYLATLNPETWAHELGHYFGLPHTDADPNTQYVDSLVTINGEALTCLQTGDGFCDTNADLETCVHNDSTCTVSSCNPTTDPFGVPYHPDVTLLMSDYSGCRNRFSNEQRQLMRTLYLYHPSYEAVRNAPALCITPKHGFIERNCSDYSPEINNPINPLIDLPVEIRGASGTCNAQDNPTDTLGRYLTMPCTLAGPVRRILPDKDFGDNPLEGVTTLDLLIINKSILGNPAFQNPFQMIAADANNSGSITTFDIVEIRKLILGITTNLQAGSWRYVPKLCTETQTFRDSFYTNPFLAKFHDPFQGFERKYKSAGTNIPNTDSWMDHVSLFTTSPIVNSDAAWSFTGIKVGDVNCNASIDGNFSNPNEHTFQVLPGNSTSISTGITKRVEIIATASSTVVAWQFGATYASDSLTMSNVNAGNFSETFDEENFSIFPADSSNTKGRLRAIWYAPDGNPVDINHKVLFEIQATAAQNIGQLEQVFQLNKETLPFYFYDEDGVEISNVTLTLRVSDISQGFQAKNQSEKSGDSLKPLSVKAYPVPFSSEIGFSIQLPKDDLVNISIYNATGMLEQNFQVSLPAGLRELQISNLAHLPSGLYWYSVQAGNQRVFGKLNKR